MFRLVLIFSLLLLSPALSSGEVLVGVIMTGKIPYYEAMHEAFVNGLKKKLPPGEEVEFILQRPFPDPIAWTNAARKLIAIEVDLIVSYGSPATHAVLFEKSDIPVIYAGIYDPASSGISEDSVTGSGYRVPLSSLLRYFKQVKDINKLWVVYSSTEEDSVRQMNELLVLAKQQRIDLSRADIRSHDDIKKLLKVNKDDAVYFTCSSLAHIWKKDILSLLRKKRTPAVDVFPDRNIDGMLITLYQPPEPQGEKAAGIAAKIINGAEPETIVPELLRKTELVFNLIEAKGLGVEMPMQLVVEATEVIR